MRGELRHPRLSTVDLAGRVVHRVRPVGKHLLVRFDDGFTLHNHLRMDGAWHLYRPDARWRRPAHQVRAVLATAERVAVGFALHDLSLVRTRDEHRLVGHLGPDPLAPDWTEEHVAEAVRRLSRSPDRPLAEALLDQRNLAGIGNLYATEVCFLLGDAPATPMSRVDADRAVRLSHELLTRNAWHPEQSTTGERHPDRRHWVYGRRTCLRCRGDVHREHVGTGTTERVTYRCPRCQP